MSTQKNVHDILAKEVGHLKANDLMAEVTKEITDQVTAEVTGSVLDNLAEHLLKRYDGRASKALAALDVVIWGIER